MESKKVNNSEINLKTARAYFFIVALQKGMAADPFNGALDT